MRVEGVGEGGFTRLECKPGGDVWFQAPLTMHADSAGVKGNGVTEHQQHSYCQPSVAGRHHSPHGTLKGRRKIVWKINTSEPGHRQSYQPGAWLNSKHSLRVSVMRL